MKAELIFPHTAWSQLNLGFAGIFGLQKTLQDKGAKLNIVREYQAIIIRVENLDEEKLDMVINLLPEGYEIPALIEDHCAVLSKSGADYCRLEETRFQELIRQAHIKIITGPQEQKTVEKSITNIDYMCDVFADIEGMAAPLKEFNIERLLQNITIDLRFAHKLAGVLVDIKTIWFALEYDTLQLARNSSPDFGGQSKIYGLPEMMGKKEEQDIAKRFRRYIYISNSIVRIRSIWEKLIGLAVLLERPADFEKTLNAKRVRRTFIKQFENSKDPVTHIIWDYVHSLEPFEERFRTPELHKTGRAIWWTTQEILGEEMNRLLAYRNDINHVLSEILTVPGTTPTSSN